MRGEIILRRELVRVYLPACTERCYARFERAFLAGNYSCRESIRNFLAFHPLAKPSSLSLMSAAKRIASTLNKWARDGLESMDGADSEALNRLLDDYFLCEAHQGNPQLPGCMNNRLTIIIINYLDFWRWWWRVWGSLQCSWKCWWRYNND